MHGSGFIQAALQGGLRVIGMSWGYIVHIRRVSQNQWNVLDCFGMFFVALQHMFIVLRRLLFCNLS